MPKINEQMTLNAFKAMADRQGGDLHIENSKLADDYFSRWVRSCRVPVGYKPFKISIYDFDKDEDVVTLYLLINPSDISIGQAHISSNSYTRVGWVSTLWGRQQATIAASGLSAGFFYVNGENCGGLTNFYKKRSEAFINFLNLIAIFKNNGAYYLKATNQATSQGGQNSVVNSNQTLFKDGTSRVINVLDAVKIDFDDSIYYGSFSTLTVTDSAINPYLIEYNFEYVISSYGSDLTSLDGHVKRSGNEVDGDIEIGVQGSTTKFNRSIILNEKELQAYFPYDNKPYVDDSSSYLRGNASDNRLEKDTSINLGRYTYKNLSKYIQLNPQIEQQLIEIANKMGLTKDQLAAIIHFESAGTWDPFVPNPYSSAIGLGQWINSTARQMAPELEKRGFISDASQIKTSLDMVSFISTPEQQISLYDVYADTTRVSGGRTLKQAMASASNSEEAFNIYMIGHFYPAYVGKSLDEPFPPSVQKVNPGIRTPRDYINNVRLRMNRQISKQNTIATANN